MPEQLEELRLQASDELRRISDSKELELWRIRYLGRKSKLSLILRSLSDLPLDERKSIGAIAIGRLHPITQTLEEICHVFQSMGFQVLEGPDVERNYYNFEALNIPENHPARDMFATLWVDSSMDEKARLLRTHTSPMQIRIMEQR